MNIRQVFVTMLLALIISLVVVFVYTPSNQGIDSKETAYERVIRTNTLRCAYAAAMPDIIMNHETGELSGYQVEIAETIADKLGLKVDWVEEVGFGEFAEGLKTGRYDAFCGIIAMAPHRAREAMFTSPTLYMPMYAYVRADDNRFSSLEDMNKPEVKAVDIDGEVFQVITRKYLPNATEYSLPNINIGAQVFVEIENNKGDVAIHVQTVFGGYDKNNPGKLKRAFDEPIMVTPAAMAVARGEHDLAAMLNTSIHTLQNVGIIDSILNKHGMSRYALYPVSQPYKLPSEK